MDRIEKTRAWEISGSFLVKRNSNSFNSGIVRIIIMPPTSSLANRLKYACAVTAPVVILGGSIAIWLLCLAALIYTNYGTAEKRERYKQQQDEYERVSRERRLERRRKKAQEEEMKKQS